MRVDSVLGQPVDLRVVLPDRWWLIPLTDEPTRTSAVAALVAEQFRGVDNQPLLKSALQRKFGRAAASAAAVNGRYMAVSLMQVEGLPLSATMTMYWLQLGRPYGQSHVRDLQQSFAANSEPEPGTETDAETGTGTGAEPESLVRGDFAVGEALRRVRTTRPGEGDDPDLPRDVPVLQVDYWVEMPDHTGMAQLTFSSPLVMWREPMLSLFDAIASSASWGYAVPPQSQPQSSAQSF